jgi:16S rRNA (guanine966-N2)-methyltransferase
MRIIAGKFKGKKISPPTNIKARPTTDFAKEGIFNVLKNYKNLDGVNFLDVFAGTGNISYEMFSRGAASGDSVDISLASHMFRKKMIDVLEVDMRSYKLDAFRYLRTCKKKYDVIFCDPPYGSTKFDRIGFQQRTSHQKWSVGS